MSHISEYSSLVEQKTYKLCVNCSIQFIPMRSGHSRIRWRKQKSHPKIKNADRCFLHGVRAPVRNCTKRERCKVMWLLRFHFAISVLCLITFIGFRTVYDDAIKENGWIDDKKPKKMSAWLIFFVPLMNILSVACLFMMIFVKKQDFEKKCEEAKKNHEVSADEKSN